MKVPWLLIITLFVLTAILVKPPLIQANGLLYGGVGSDDFCYMATATSIAYGQWPSYSKEEICRSEMPMASVGPGFMAAPFVFAFSLIDRVTNNSVVSSRTESNIVNSATSWGFIFATLFYFGLTLVFLRKILSIFGVARFEGDLAIILMIFFQGGLLYIVRRPINSHAYELFSLTALLLFLMTKKDQILMGGLLCFLAGTARYNDLPLAFLWPSIFFFVDSKGSITIDKTRIASLTKIGVVAAALLLVLKGIPTYLSGQEKYSGMAKGLLFGSKPSGFWIEHFKYVLFGTDFGIIFTAPFLLIGLTTLFFSNYPQKKRFIILGLTLFINFYLAVSFGTNGGWYGYRYLIFSTFPVVIVPFAFFISKMLRQYKKLSWAVITCISIVPVISMLLFEGNDSLVQTQTLILGQTEYGNPEYQFKVWHILIHEPAEALRILTKGVPVYLVYCLANIVGMARHLPAIIQEKFRMTGLSLFLRTLAMFAIPIVPLYLSDKE